MVGYLRFNGDVKDWEFYYTGPGVRFIYGWTGGTKSVCTSLLVRRPRVKFCRARPTGYTDQLDSAPDEYLVRRLNYCGDILDIDAHVVVWVD